MSVYFRTILLLFLGFSHIYSQNNFKNEDELKKQADLFFEDEEFGKAYKLYSQLVSNYPKDPNYNYRLGVCMLYAEPDKKKCYSYLEFANKNIEKCEKEVKFYLAKAYHFNFRFDEAMSMYSQYKTIASNSQIKKLNVDNEIQSCKNGKRLLSNLKDLVVLDKKQLPESDYFRSYDLKPIGGKLLVKPSEFFSSLDKKKKNNSIIYLPKGNEQLYYSSYGEKGEQGKDLFVVRKLPNGEWSKPQNLGAPINTNFDEDYPFLHPNGKVLYFASKGHNSMGGYDLFKSVFDEGTQKWSVPVNLDFPINTPNDDILFVTDSLEKTAYFSSTRKSPYGKIDVYKINTEKRAPEFLYIKGSVLKKSEGQSLESVIKIKNIESGDDEGKFEANADGNYLIKIPNGGKFIFTVETPGFTTQSEGININRTSSLSPLKQVIYYKAEKLIVENLFETGKDDEMAYLQLLEVIEQQSNLDVNADNYSELSDNTSNQLVSKENPTKQNVTKTDSINTDFSSINKDSELAVTSDATSKKEEKSEAKADSKNYSNNDLVDIAKSDAKELKIEADELKKSAQEAKAFADKIKLEANKKSLQAEDKQVAYNLSKDENEKEKLKEDAEKIRAESVQLISQANTAANVAQQINENAINKEKEAELTLKYANELEKANKTKNNLQAIEQLEALQKEISSLSSISNKSKNASDIYRVQADEKSKEIERILARNDGVLKESERLQLEMINLEKEISENKDESLKENLDAQKEELSTEISDKKKEIELNNRTVKELKIEKEALESQADFVQNMINEVNGDTNYLEKIVKKEEDQNQSTNNTSNQVKEDIAVNEKVKEIENFSKTINDNLNKESGKNLIESEKSKLEKLISLQKELLADKKTILNTIKSTEQKKAELNSIMELEKAIEISEQKYATANSLLKELESESNQLTTIKNNKLNSENQNDSLISNQNNSSIQETQNKNGILKKEELANENSAKTSSENELFSNTNFSDEKSKKLFEQAKKEFQKANDLTNSSKSQVKSDQADFKKVEIEISLINSKADSISLEAMKKRKSAKNLSGTERQLAINESSNLEAQSGTLRLESARKKSELHLNQIENNADQISFYKKEITNLSSSESDKLNNLLSESSIYLKQAEALKKEAETQVGDEAKAAAYHNAEEKENLAISKQNEALILLKSKNPTLSWESGSNNLNGANSAVNMSSLQAKGKALKTLFDAHKEELIYYTKEYDKLNNLDIDSSKILRNSSQQLLLSANSIVIKANDEKDLSAKNRLYVEANMNIQESINKVKSAIEIYQVKKREIESAQKSNSDSSKDNNLTNKDTLKLNDTISSASDKLLTSNSDTISIISDSTKSISLTNNKGSLSNEIKTIETDKISQNATETNSLDTARNEQSNLNKTENNFNQGNTKDDDNIESDPIVSSKMSAQKIKEIKESETFKNYSQLKNEYLKYSNLVAAERKEAEENMNLATQFLKESTEKRMASDQLEGNQKDSLREVAVQLDRKANIYKAKSDSLTELADNTEALANSKKAESELFLQSLDKQTYENINALIDSKTAATMNRKKEEEKLIVETKDTSFVNNSVSKVTNDQSNSTQNQKLETDSKRASIINQNNDSINSDLNVEKGYEILNTDAYTANKPIPIDEKLPNGLLFRVQIGAFKNPIPVNLFKGLSPVGGEKTAQGLIRYQVGMFNKFEKANAVKNDLRKMGYQGAFVVAYLNGKRIDMNEAMEQLRNNAVSVKLDSSSSAGINSTSNIPATNTITKQIDTEKSESSNQNQNSGESNPISSVKELNKMDGMLYTVQIGVFSNDVSGSQLFNLKPIFREKLPNGTYRYTAGIYSNEEKTNVDRIKVNELGIKDAFVSAYLNGQRISVIEASEKSRNDSVKFPEEQPIQFDQSLIPSPIQNKSVPLEVKSAPETMKVDNGVVRGPDPSSENGVKIGEEGICFKVQIGAFKNKIPSSTIEKFMKIKDWPINSYSINDLYLYSVGNFVNGKYARELLKKVIENGISDAFIIVFKDGKKLYGEEAIKLINQE